MLTSPSCTLMAQMRNRPTADHPRFEHLARCGSITHPSPSRSALM